jgi:ABC-type uncharacterized transport system YnjBCD ATPase subunit
LAELKKEIDILTKTSAVLKHLLDIMVTDEINKMAGLVTYGLKTVFDDQNLNFVPKVIKKNEKIHIELKTENDGIEGALGSFGGSVAVVESYLMRVLCILKKKYARLILLDETLAAVGVEYKQNTNKMIQQLAKKLGMDVLLVTQDREIDSSIDHAYFITKTSNGITMEKVK